MSDLSQEAAILQWEMRQVRTEAAADVEQMVADARTLMDWRHHLKRHPMLFAAAGLALGYAFVPKKKEVVRLDASALRELAKDKRFSVQVANNEQASAAGGGIIAALVGMAAQAALRSGTSMFTSQLQQFMARRAMGDVPPSSAQPDSAQPNST